MKRVLPGVKAGHAGTLDPFADGVLLVCTGRETKYISTLVDTEKEYQGRLRLGMETDTLDISGSLVRREEPLPLDLAQVKTIAERFCGEIEQVPPSYSAIHITGQRAYKLARTGQKEAPPPRRVLIYRLLVTQLGPDWIDFSVVCSKGTYIRSLARDWAHGLGTVGFLSHLTRTRIGSYDIGHSMEVTELPTHLARYIFK